MNLTGRGGFQDRKQDINKKGRPPSFNQIHRVALKIANEKVQTEDGGKMLRVESILRELAASKDVQAKKLFLEYSHGKPADRIELDELQPRPTLILHYAHEFDKISGDTKVAARSLPDSASNGEGPLRLSMPDADAG